MKKVILIFTLTLFIVCLSLTNSSKSFFSNNLTLKDLLKGSIAQAENPQCPNGCLAECGNGCYC